MQSWIVDHPSPIDDGPLRRIDCDVPVPESRQVLVRVSCCGVCRTDLHLAEGDLSPKRRGTTPGHEVVGIVAERGSSASRFEIGDRVGIPWLASTDGTCTYCRRRRENLCAAPTFTGWDVDGGYADYCLVNEAFAYRLPTSLTDEQAAPLLCAGIIGYRALLRADIHPGGAVGILGLRRQRPFNCAACTTPRSAGARPDQR